MATSTATPTPKMAAVGITGAVALIIVWAAGLFGLEVPAEVAAAFTVVLAFVAGYFKTDATSPGKHEAL